MTKEEIEKQIEYSQKLLSEYEQQARLADCFRCMEDILTKALEEKTKLKELLKMI